VSSHFELDPSAYDTRRRGHLFDRRVGVVAGHLASLPSGARVLEVGSGPGAMLAALAALRSDLCFVGVEAAPAMVAHAVSAHAGANISFLAGDHRSSPPPDCAAAFCVDVLHHVHDPPDFARWLARALAPGGTFLAIEPNSRNPWIWLSQERMRRRGLDEDHFDREAWAEAMAGAGFARPRLESAFLVPGGVGRVPRVIDQLERRLERATPLGGSVVLRTRRAPG
jgi:SAM-dependent methyltransferase